MSNFTTWRSLVDGEEIGAIPDSVVHQYITEDFTQTNWPDSEGNSDMDTISGLSEDSNAFNGTGGVGGDGTDDHGLSDTMGDFGSQLDGGFAVVFGFSIDNQADLMATLNDDDFTKFFVRTASGEGATDDRLNFIISDTGNDRIGVNSDTDITDGGEYVAILNKSQGTSASDMEIYFKPDEDASEVAIDESFGTASNFEFDMTYFARNLRGDIDSHADATMTDIRWFSSPLDLSEREQVFDQYNWYDPDTDAPS